MNEVYLYLQQSWLQPVFEGLKILLIVLVAYILQRLEASSDHPTTVNFPEGEYLKGLVLLKR